MPDLNKFKVQSRFISCTQKLCCVLFSTAYQSTFTLVHFWGLLVVHKLSVRQVFKWLYFASSNDKKSSIHWLPVGGRSLLKTMTAKRGLCAADLFQVVSSVLGRLCPKHLWGSFNKDSSSLSCIKTIDPCYTLWVFSVSDGLTSERRHSRLVWWRTPLHNWLCLHQSQLSQSFASPVHQ